MSIKIQFWMDIGNVFWWSWNGNIPGTSFVSFSMLFPPRTVHYCLRGHNLDYGVVYIPRNTFVEFWNYPLPRLHRKFYVALLRNFRFVCLNQRISAVTRTVSWFLTAPPEVFPASLQHRQSRLFWDEASSPWKNSCRFQNSARIVAYGVTHPVAVPWVLELVLLFRNRVCGFRQKFGSSLEYWTSGFQY